MGHGYRYRHLDAGAKCLFMLLQLFAVAGKHVPLILQYTADPAEQLLSGSGLVVIKGGRMKSAAGGGIFFRPDIPQKPPPEAKNVLFREDFGNCNRFFSQIRQVNCRNDQVQILWQRLGNNRLVRAHFNVIQKVSQPVGQLPVQEQRQVRAAGGDEHDIFLSPVRDHPFHAGGNENADLHSPGDRQFNIQALAHQRDQLLSQSKFCGIGSREAGDL